MADFDTVLESIMVRIVETRTRSTMTVRNETTATFISQVLAERHNLAPQRAKQRTSPEGAVGAYSTGAKIAVKRMPMGYRTSIVT